MPAPEHQSPEPGKVDSREEAQRALQRSLVSLREVMAQDAEVSRVTTSLRAMREGDSFTLDLEMAMRGHRR